MKPFFRNHTKVTIKQGFSVRLLILMVSFSLLASIGTVTAYHYQRTALNRVELDSQLLHFRQQLSRQERSWGEDAERLVGLLVWSNVLNRPEPERSASLRSLFTVQAGNANFDAVLIRDADSPNLPSLFAYWKDPEETVAGVFLQPRQGRWYDSVHGILYSVIRKRIGIPNQTVEVLFLRPWDSATLKQLTVRNSTSYLMLGSHALLSSAGHLELEQFQPGTVESLDLPIGSRSFVEGSSVLEQVTLPGGVALPLRVVVRMAKSHGLPVLAIALQAAALIGVFSFMLFVVLGQWMRKLGDRLEALAVAALAFQRAQHGESVAGISSILRRADAGEQDQISVVAQEMGVMMDNAARQDEEHRAYLETLELLDDAIIEFTPDGRLLRATDAWKKLTGITDFSTCAIDKCVHGDDANALREQLAALATGEKGQCHLRFRLGRHDGLPSSFLWVEARFAVILQQNAVTAVRGVIRDITSSYQQERQINHMALHDSLTDLPNRVLLEDRLKMALLRAARANLRVALGFIDLDHFKQVNDNFDHKTGDLFLKAISRRLLAGLRSSDTLARWGGDEFVVLFPDIHDLHDAKALVQKLGQAAKDTIHIGDTEFPIAFSAGFAIYPDDAESGEILLTQADRAMFYAKAQGRNNIQFFHAIAQKEKGKRSFYIQSKLTQAIRDRQIQCWLQPLVDARSGKVTGAEALARWLLPEHGWISPSVFVPMAESMGLIGELGQQVWQHAIQALVLLPASHRLSVNLSKRQLFSEDITSRLYNDVTQAGIAPSRIMLEVTESIALSDVEFSRERIAELAAKGFGIAVDDFGVGYSSLSQLHEIPVDELKLDISFVRRLHEKGGIPIAQAIIAIAKSLELQCVAEGVEDETTALILSDLGVDLLQGYHFGKPMPIDDYVDWLRERAP